MDGGITSAVLLEAVVSLSVTLQDALLNFTSSGFASEAELGFEQMKQQTQQETINWRRVGAPRYYNMKCYKQSFLPKTVPELLKLGEKESIDCAVSMLMWVHNEGANFSRYVDLFMWYACPD